MPKLHLKRTPEEEAQHILRKEQRRAKRKRSHAHDHNYEGASGSHSHKRYHQDEDTSESHSRRKWASSDEDEEEYGPQPAGSACNTHKSMEDYAAELEEQRFREKMFDALGDDERLDGVEARLNDFAHVPDRWRSSSSKRQAIPDDEFDDAMKLDPQFMDDEEYTEWVRMGMYRKTHAKEYEERQRRKAARAAQKAEAKARKEEGERLERQAKEEERKRRCERESHKMEHAREEYHSRWKLLLTLHGDESGAESKLHFDDIPWPIVAAHRQKPEKKRGGNHTDSPLITVGDLTVEAISAFILPLVSADTIEEMDEEKVKKARKERLRETFLRFHPDKFEGRFMHRIREGDRDRVREGIGQVSRVLNGLLGKEA
ncbi:hypothetical protein BDQ17DRAFT_1387217 [Cyathus striatus]|nr:hypothetical protein BDQ17DRAFT_1387217 [Cyathus striatus]